MNEVKQQNQKLERKVNTLEQDNRTLLRDKGADASSTIQNLKELLTNREISKEERDMTQKVREHDTGTLPKVEGGTFHLMCKQYF